MFSDFRVVLRQLRLNPGFTVVAVLSLALGAGVNATIFSLVDGLYLRPMAVPEPGRLVRVFLSAPDEPHGYLSYPEYEELRASVRSFSGASAFMRRGGWLVRDQNRKLLTVNITSPDFFTVMGVQPFLGRLYGAGREEAPAAVLGYGAWQRIFGGNEAVIGRTVQLTEAQVTIAGVLPPDFRDTDPGGAQDLWVPPATWSAMIGGSTQDFTNRENRIFETFGRLRKGASQGAAHSESAALSRRWQEQYRSTNGNRGLLLIADSEWRWEDSRKESTALLAIVLLVALTGCVNVANLLLARAEARRREIAVRAALGATGWRLIRLFLVQTFVLGLLGLSAGVLFAFWLVQSLPALMVPPPGFFSTEVFTADGRVLTGAALVTLATILAAGLAPALAALKSDLTGSLRGLTIAGSRWPVRNILAGVQAALSVVLLACAGVLAASFWQTRTADIGMTRENLLIPWVMGERAMYRPAADAVRALPGVKRMAVAMRAPFSLSGRGMFKKVSDPGNPNFGGGQPEEIKYNTIDEHFLPVMDQRVLRGRGFSAADMAPGRQVMLINESMARRYWPHQDPIGRVLRTGGPDGRAWEIVGVVNDAPFNKVVDRPEPYLYLPYWNTEPWDLTMLIEPAGDRETLATAIRQTVASVSPGLEVASLVGLEELRTYSARQTALLAELASALALLGVTLTAVGLYGVLAYGIARRRREIGVRMALGATQEETVALVLREACLMVLAGCAAGLPLAFLAIKTQQKMLFGIPPWHWPSFLGATGLMLLVALLAAIEPARRATQVNPIDALRSE